MKEGRIQMKGNMTDQDWANYLNEWEESFYGSGTSDKHDIQPVNDGIPIKTAKGRTYTFLHVEMTTPKAVFFVMDVSKGKRGFWVPKAAILYQGVNQVEVADWCELNEINFT